MTEYFGRHVSLVPSLDPPMYKQTENLNSLVPYEYIVIVENEERQLQS